MACTRGAEWAVECLLKAGANPLLCDENGRSPLHWAAVNGHTSCVTALLTSTPGKEGIDMRDQDGQSALMYVRASFICVSSESARRARDSGRLGMSCLCWLRVSHCSMSRYACFQGKLDVVKILVRYGADVNLREKDGITALHWAALQVCFACFASVPGR